MTTENAHAVANAIELALPPVFLLSGIAGLLSVISGRLSRIVDRWRALCESGGAPLGAEAVASELHLLRRRRRWTSVALAACTVAALLVCIVIASLFVEAMLGTPLQGSIGFLFIGAMLALVIGLAFFMREVHLGTTLHVRIPDRLPRGESLEA